MCLFKFCFSMDRLPGSGISRSRGSSSLQEVGPCKRKPWAVVEAGCGLGSSVEQRLWSVLGSSGLVPCALASLKPWDVWRVVERRGRGEWSQPLTAWPALLQGAPEWLEVDEGQQAGAAVDRRPLLYLAGAPGGQGQVLLEQLFGGELPQAQLAPGAQCCGRPQRCVGFRGPAVPSTWEPERRRLCPGVHPAAVVPPPPALPPSPLFLLLFFPLFVLTLPLFLLVLLPLLFLCPRCGWGPLRRRPDSELTGVPFVEGIPSAPCQTFSGRTVSRGASLQLKVSGPNALKAVKPFLLAVVF